MFRIGMIQMATGEFEGALSTFKSIISQIQKDKGSSGYAPEAKLLNCIGVVQYELGRDNDAFESFLMAYGIQKRLSKDYPPLAAAERPVANTLSNLGFVYASQGKYSEAYRVFKESLDILKKYVPVDHPSIVTVEENMAHVRAYGAEETDPGPKRHVQSKILGCLSEPPESRRGQSEITACLHLQ
jgi:tetratricopeptide (TPR) repeat protein